MTANNSTSNATDAPTDAPTVAPTNAPAVVPESLTILVVASTSGSYGEENTQDTIPLNVVSQEALLMQYIAVERINNGLSVHLSFFLSLSHTIFYILFHMCVCVYVYIYRPNYSTKYNSDS